jgi:hypothetical protein
MHKSDDRGFDCHRYRQLLAEAIDEPKRRALIDLLILEQAKDRLAEQCASQKKIVTMAAVARVVRTEPTPAAESTADRPTSSNASDIFYIPPGRPIG